VTDRVAAFEAVFRAHSRPLLAYAVRRVSRVEDAADVVAETMLVAWRRLDDVPSGDDARPWLFGVARNVLANHVRTTTRGERLGAKLREQLAGVTLDDHADAAGTAVVVRDALGRLEDDDRELIRLTSWEGLGPSEIAVAMELPVATVRTRLHRARRRLREELAAVGWSRERIARAGHEEADEQLLVRRGEGDT
jgi:RNA polymerase sigma-70 factor (ECF subfamily)